MSTAKTLAGRAMAGQLRTNAVAARPKTGRASPSG